jgi:hypothetical protein
LCVVQRTQAATRLQWQFEPGDIQGFKLHKGALPSVHPDPVTFPDGCRAAFTWTTDDGLEANLAFAPIFISRGFSFTAFVNPCWIGNPGRLSWGDLRDLHGQGIEIANHTQNHVPLIDDRALTLEYLGVCSCTVVVDAGVLRTYIGAGCVDLEVELEDPTVYYLVDLAAHLDAQADYASVLLYAPNRQYATQSRWLDPVVGLSIGQGAPPGTLTTIRGVHDDAELCAEILDAQFALENSLQLLDPAYRCRTLAFPHHAHRQRAMSILNELGCLAARSGPIGERPFYSEGRYSAGFTTSYEVPLSWPRPENEWDEAATRAMFQARMAEWKANAEWAVLMVHDESVSDSLHVEWMIDEISSDSEVWIAPFGQVAAYLDSFATDVGVPATEEGVASAWLYGLSETDTTYVVVTAYNDAREESGWSNEVATPPLVSAAGRVRPVIRPELLAGPRVFPNPFTTETTFEFLVPVSGPLRIEILNVSGRLARAYDMGWVPVGVQRVPWDCRDGSGQPVAAGVYWVRVRTSAGAQMGKAVLRR